MGYNTEAFAALYRSVTSHLSTLAGEVALSPQPPPFTPELDWLKYLIAAFQSEFEDWERDPELKDYLEGLVKWPAKLGGSLKPVHPAVRLAGHVFLHVAYDLPRGIAATLSPSPNHQGELAVPSGSPTFQSPPVFYAGYRLAVRWFFLRVTPAFEDALLSDQGQQVLRDAGIPLGLLRVVGSERERNVLQVMAQWVLALRCAAWIYAEILADAVPHDRAALVRRLRRAIVEAQKDVFKRHRIQDFRVISLPVFSVAAPIQVWAATTQHWPAVLAVILAAGGAVWLANLRVAQRRMIDAIDALGLALFQALSGAIGLPPEELRSQTMEKI